MSDADNATTQPCEEDARAAGLPGNSTEDIARENGTSDSTNSDRSDGDEEVFEMPVANTTIDHNTAGLATAQSLPEAVDDTLDAHIPPSDPRYEEYRYLQEAGHLTAFVIEGGEPSRRMRANIPKQITRRRPFNLRKSSMSEVTSVDEEEQEPAQTQNAPVATEIAEAIGQPVAPHPDQTVANPLPISLSTPNIFDQFDWDDAYEDFEETLRTSPVRVSGESVPAPTIAASSEQPVAEAADIDSWDEIYQDAQETQETLAEEALAEEASIPSDTFNPQPEHDGSSYAGDSSEDDPMDVSDNSSSGGGIIVEAGDATTPLSQIPQFALPDADSDDASNPSSPVQADTNNITLKLALPELAYYINHDRSALTDYINQHNHAVSARVFDLEFLISRLSPERFPSATGTGSFDRWRKETFVELQNQRWGIVRRCIGLQQKVRNDGEQLYHIMADKEQMEREMAMQRTLLMKAREEVEAEQAVKKEAVTKMREMFKEMKEFEKRMKEAMKEQEGALEEVKNIETEKKRVESERDSVKEELEFWKKAAWKCREAAAAARHDNTILEIRLNAYRSLDAGPDLSPNINPALYSTSAHNVDPALTSTVPASYSTAATNVDPALTTTSAPAPALVWDGVIAYSEGRVEAEMRKLDGIEREAAAVFNLWPECQEKLECLKEWAESLEETKKAREMVAENQRRRLATPNGKWHEYERINADGSVTRPEAFDTEETPELECGERVSDALEAFNLEETSDEEVDAKGVEPEEVVAKEVEAKEVEAKEVEATEVDATEVDATEVEAMEVEATEVEAKEVDATEVDTKVVDTKDIDTKDVDTKDVGTKDVDTKDVNTKDVDTKEVDTKEVDTKDVDTKDVNTKDVDTKEVNTKVVDTKDVNTKEVDAEDVDTKDVDTKDVDTKDVDTKDVNTEDVDTMEVNTKVVDTKDIDTKDVDTKDVDTKEVETNDVNAEEVDSKKVVIEGVFAEGADAEDIDAEWVDAQETPEHD